MPTQPILVFVQPPSLKELVAECGSTLGLCLEFHKDPLEQTPPEDYATIRLVVVDKDFDRTELPYVLEQRTIVVQLPYPDPLSLAKRIREILRPT